MKARCYNKNHHAYHRYGGRGIKVCERWLNDSGQFVRDMGLKPSPIHSLDRIDPNGDYSPENCRWATHAQQALNKRNTTSHPGVHWDSNKRTWKAMLSVKGQIVLNKRFRSLDDAIRARSIAYEKWVGVEQSG